MRSCYSLLLLLHGGEVGYELFEGIDDAIPVADGVSQQMHHLTHLLLMIVMMHYDAGGGGDDDSDDDGDNDGVVVIEYTLCDALRDG